MAKKRKRKYKKIVEIPIAENIAEMNLNQATRGNAGSPYFGSYLNRNAPRWAKVLFFLVAIFIAMSLIILLIAALLR